MRRTILALIALAGLGVAALAIQSSPAEACGQIACPLGPVRTAPIRITATPTPSPAPGGSGAVGIKTHADVSRVASLRPDLYTFIMGPTGMFLGMEEQYLITVRNNGPIGVHNVALTVAFPPAVAVESFEFTNQGFACATTTPHLVTCTGGFMGPGGEQGLVRINVRGVAVTAGPAEVVATANPDGAIAEPNYADNIDHYPVRVVIPR